MVKPPTSNLKYLLAIIAVVGSIILIGVVFTIVLFPGAYDTPGKLANLVVVSALGVLGFISGIKNAWDLFARFRRIEDRGLPLPKQKITKSSQQQSKEEQLWEKYSQASLQVADINKECAWVLPWSGLSVDKIELIYDERVRYDENNMSVLARQALDSWRQKKYSRLEELEKEGLGALARLEEVEYIHGTYKYRIFLSPTKYLYYIAIQQRLGNDELRDLRDQTYRNALEGIPNGERLELPSHFAIHMAVVSREHKAIIRKRDSSTALYPGAWEAGVGEFMHGPNANVPPDLRCFDEEGKADLLTYLQAAVKEELDYYHARSGDFRLYGFAVERQTLGPKLLVVYKSNAPTETLLKGATRKARDRAPEASSIDLTPRGIAEALTNPRYQSWGPTSKLALMLALTRDASSDSERSSMIMELKQIISDIEKYR